VLALLTEEEQFTLFVTNGLVFNIRPNIIQHIKMDTRFINSFIPYFYNACWAITGIMRSQPQENTFFAPDEMLKDARLILHSMLATQSFSEVKVVLWSYLHTNQNSQLTKHLLASFGFQHDTEDAIHTLKEIWHVDEQRCTMDLN
jgi:hypothetical protein